MILVPFKQHANRDVKEELNILIAKRIFKNYMHEQGNYNGLKNCWKMKDCEINLQTEHTYLLIDRLVVKDFDEDDIHRIADSVGTAFYEGEGEMYAGNKWQQRLLHFSNKFELDGIEFEEPVPNLFSFNNPFGACPTCEGFSQVLGIDPDLVIPDKRLSVYEGAVAPWKGEKLG